MISLLVKCLHGFWENRPFENLTKSVPKVECLGLKVFVFQMVTGNAFGMFGIRILAEKKNSCFSCFTFDDFFTSNLETDLKAVQFLFRS